MSPDYESVLPLDADHPNIVVPRPFSKICGMAGLRCGYGVAQPATLKQMTTRQSRNDVNATAMVAARASLRDQLRVAESKQRNAETRAMLFERLKTLGYECTPSEANSFMIKLGRDCRPLAAAIKSGGILVGRPFPRWTTSCA